LLFISGCAIFDFKEPINAYWSEKHYRRDRESAESMLLRSFIAIEIPAEIQTAIADSAAPLKKNLPKTLIRWVAPQNVHLTLKFL
jgi:hypothetical protein